MMDKHFENIIENEKLFSELSAQQFSDKSGITEATIKDVLNIRSIKIRKTISETNKLIEKYVTPYIEHPDLITADIASSLQNLAEKLSGYKENLDNGLAFDIRTALTIYAKKINNLNLYIENLFFKGLSLFYLDSNLFRTEMSNCYEEIISYSNRYAEFDRPTRNIIVRAYGNHYISAHVDDLDDRFRRFDLAIDFWTNTAQKVDPDFPWHLYFRNVEENLCSSVNTALRSENIDYINEEYTARYLDSATRLYEETIKGKIFDSHDYTSTEVKSLYFLRTAQYYNNIISIKQLTDFFYEVYKQATHDYDYDNLYKKLHVTALYFYYLEFIPEEDLPPDKRKLIIDEIEADVYEYAMHIPHTVSRSHVSTLLANFAIGADKVFDDFEYLKLLLSLTVFRHIPTFVHSVMVGKITYVILEYLCKYNPESFVSLPGINNVTDAREKLDQVLLFSWYASLSHDIGKIIYSHMVSFYVRRLNDKEFEMIKQHTTRSEGFIRKSPNFISVDKIWELFKPLQHNEESDDSDLFSCISDIALGHHRSYDGSFGYPADFDNLASPVKLIIDVITIADSIDAATDSVGRSYAHEKTLADMKDDILSQIGTRYSPTVANLIFDNKDLYQAIDNLITCDRYSVYYSCFSTDDLSEKIHPPTRTIY